MIRPQGSVLDPRIYPCFPYSPRGGERPTTGEGLDRRDLRLPVLELVKGRRKDVSRHKSTVRVKEDRDGNLNCRVREV